MHAFAVFLTLLHGVSNSDAVFLTLLHGVSNGDAEYSA